MSRFARLGRGAPAAAQVMLAAAAAAAAAAALVSGCTTAPRSSPPKLSVAPTSQPSASLDVRGGDVAPMYRELLAVDLETVVRVATADNLDVRQARERVEASRGRYESSVGAIFPVIVPSVAFQHFEGHNQNANGTLVATNFNDFLPALSIQWILNPAKVAYDIVAARRRFEASEQQEQAVVLDTLRAAATQYYDLVLAQAQLGVARQSVAEAEELLRITRLKVRAGTGLPTDELRAEANMQGLRQDVTLALNRFYQASVALTLTLHLDLGNRHGEANTCDSLGYIYHQLGLYRQAITRYRRAVDLFREFGDRYYEADALAHLGDTYLAAGECESARAAWRVSVDLLDQLGHADADRLRVRLRRADDPDAALASPG